MYVSIFIDTLNKSKIEVIHKKTRCKNIYCLLSAHDEIIVYREC